MIFQLKASLSYLGNTIIRNSPCTFRSFDADKLQPQVMNIDIDTRDETLEVVDRHSETKPMGGDIERRLPRLTRMASLNQPVRSGRA